MSEAKTEEIYWKCQFVSADGIEVKEILSVGDKQVVSCNGPSVEWGEEELHFELGEDPQAHLALFVLQTQKKTNEAAQFVVTPYRVGDQTSENGLILKSDTHQVRIEGLNWRVNSVIPEEERQSGEAKPYPACGPIEPNFPWIQMAVFTGVLLVTAVIIYLLAKRRSRIKKEFASIQDFKTIRSPLDELFHQLRRWERTLGLKSGSDALLEPLQYLNQFLAIKLKFPAHLWSRSKVSNWIKKSTKDTKFKTANKDFRILIKELDRKDGNKETVKDEMLQVSKMIRDFASRIDDELPDENKKGRARR